MTFSLTFNNLSFTSGGDSFAVAGNIALDFSASPNVSVAMTLLLRDTTGKVFWARGYEITLDDQDTFVEVTIAGRFYHPDYGYVVIATETPLHFNKTDGIADDNPSSGVLLFTGKDNAKALQTADDSSTFHVEADKDGDDVYEFNSGPLLWDDI